MKGISYLEIGALLSASALFLLPGVSTAQQANLNHDIVDENNEPFDMNDLVADRPLVLVVSSGT